MKHLIFAHRERETKVSFLVSIRIGKSSSRRRKQIHGAEGTVIDLSLLP